MKKLAGVYSAIFIMILLQGCSTPYFGYSEKEWQKLSDEERAVKREEYQPIIDSRGERAHTDVIDARTQSVIDRGVNGPKYGK